MNQRELELLHRAEAAERAIVEAVRQRDILLSACQDTLERLEWYESKFSPISDHWREDLPSLIWGGKDKIKSALEKVDQ